MPSFDGTIDNRWRPELDSSQRRVREQESAHVPARRSADVKSLSRYREKAKEAHDAQTRALIRRTGELERLPHGDEVRKLLDEWRWIDKMRSPAEKQRHLEPHIAAVRRDPGTESARLVFLLLVFEPVRRGVGKAFMEAEPHRKAMWFRTGGPGVSPGVRPVAQRPHEEAR